MKNPSMFKAVEALASSRVESKENDKVPTLLNEKIYLFEGSF